jgi:hypothetical protein
MRFVSRIAGKIFRRAGWLLNSIVWFAAEVFLRRSGRNAADLPLTIGITTFLNRYERFFKPLVRKLAVLFPGCRILVIANGNVMKEEQKSYLAAIKEFCDRFPGIELKGHKDPEGLSHLWNRIMLDSGNQKVLMLNDDLKIKPGFRKFIEHSGIMEETIATINSSWSHFLISHEIYEMTGPFDEGLREVGGEDDDYLARLAMSGIKPADYKTGTIARKGKKKRKSNEMNSFGRLIAGEEGGYSTVNTEYLKRKWEISDQSFEGAVEIPRKKYRYWKLKKLHE